jgi:hypothetical protein
MRASKGVTTTASAICAFSSKRTPSLADVEPDQVDAFVAKQKKFREQLAEAQKQREASALDSITQSSSVTSPSSDNGSSTSPSSVSREGTFPDIGQGLGSLSTARGTTGNNAASATATNEPPRKAGPLTNLIYGTKEGREMDAQIEASFSQVLSRGKYVHSIVFHDVKPDCVDEYVDLVGKWYPKMAGQPENKVHLVGSWRTEVGECDTFGKVLLT